MGFAQAGTAHHDGDNLAIQGAKPVGMAAQGKVFWRAGTPVYTTVTQINCGGGAIGEGNWISDAGLYTPPDAPNISTGVGIDLSQAANPAPAPVYQTCRFNTGTGGAEDLVFTLPGYDPSRTYRIRVHFAECWGGQAVGARPMQVSVNGAVFLPNVDVYALVGAYAAYTADTEDLQPLSDGTLTIGLAHLGVQPVLLNGIEVMEKSFILPVLQLNCGGVAAPPFIADDGSLFPTGGSGSANAGGAPPPNLSALTNPAPENVYRSVRFANVGADFNFYGVYTPNRTYHLRLHFCENWEPPGNRGITVIANGATLLTDWRFPAMYTGYIEEFDVTADASGGINILFRSTSSNAAIAGMELIA